MARTDAERLELYLDIRDQIDDAILASAGSPAVRRYRIGSREVERESLAAYLKEVNDIIATLTATVNSATNSGRNLVRLKRNG